MSIKKLITISSILFLPVCSYAQKLTIKDPFANKENRYYYTELYVNNIQNKVNEYKKGEISLQQYKLAAYDNLCDLDRIYRATHNFDKIVILCDDIDTLKEYARELKKATYNDIKSGFIGQSYKKYCVAEFDDNVCQD